MTSLRILQYLTMRMTLIEQEASRLLKLSPGENSRFEHVEAEINNQEEARGQDESQLRRRGGRGERQGRGGWRGRDGVRGGRRGRRA